MLVVVIVAALLAQNFDPINQSINVLGTGGGPAASVMNVLGFGLTGILVAVSAVGLFLGVKAKSLPRGALATVVIIAGAAILLLGAFPSDTQASLNDLLSMVSGLTLGLAPLVAALVFRLDPQWRRLWSPSLVIALIAFLFFAASYTGLVTGFEELAKNLNVAIGLSWVGVAGLWNMRWS
jgi:hypothetical protein